MNIIRYNSFRRINLFDNESFFCKNKDINTENDSGLVVQIRNERYKLSKYNIIKRFDDKKTVIYNTLYDSIVVLDEEETYLFDEYDSMKCHSKLVYDLFQLGILISNCEDETILMSFQNEELIYNRRGIPSVTILPTQACNAKCEYCFADHNKKNIMDNNTIKNLIIFLKDNFKEGDKVLFRWFGGEPLLAVETINNIIDEVNICFNGNLEFSSLMFTNGSLLDDDIIKTAKNKWKLEKIQLTLDGYAEEHNSRKSYNNPNIDYYKKTIIDIRRLLDAGIKVDCRINLDKDNIKEIDYICNDLLQYNTNSLFRPRFTILRPSDCGFNKFNYITVDDLEWAYDIIYNKLIQYGFLRNIADLFPHRQRESCIMKSINKVIVASDGKLYKCLQQVFDDESAVGELVGGIDHRKFMSCCRTQLHDECRECVYLPVCSGGCDAYWRLSKTENISPCIREKYFIDMLLKMIHDYYE